MTMLPYPEVPILICYHNKAFPFGIIQANSPEDITKWLCTKSINCVYNPNSPKNKFDLAIWDTWGNWEGITTHQVISIRKDLLVYSILICFQCLKSSSITELLLVVPIMKSTFLKAGV